MTDRPIVFSKPMVRALLAGRKTQTRRVLKLPQAGLEPPYCAPYDEGARAVWFDPFDCGIYRFFGVAGAAVGDRLWVREAHSLHHAHGQDRSDGKRWGPWGGLPTRLSPDGAEIAYFREGFDRCAPRWRSSIHMPRWASRLTLTVTDVRVQRVQEISEEDAIMEGCRPFFDEGSPQILVGPNGAEHKMLPLKGPLDAFQNLWDSINAGHGFGWEANPWVCAITFTVARCNIDEPAP